MVTSQVGSCLLHEGYTNHAGYGQRAFEGRVRLAHRVAYCQHHGLRHADIEGQVVLHSCDNPPCINPAHLSLGTQGDNMKDMSSKGRGRGNTTPAVNRAMSDAEVSSIRASYVKGSRLYGQPALARAYGVDHTVIGDIVRHETYKELP